MKTLTFNYTKKDGSTSERMLLALVTPSDKYAGIDLSELDPVAANNFVNRAKDLHTEYIEKLQRLQNEFDLKYSYRQFIATQMDDVTEI